MRRSQRHVVPAAFPRKSRRPRDGRLTFRPGRFTWIAIVGALVVFLAVAVLTFVLGAPAWQRLASVALSLAALAGVAETALTRLELGAERMELVHGFRRRVIPRTEIEAVTWAKGAGVSVLLTSGRWVRLPDVGGSAQGLTNTVRAWLNRTAPAAVHRTGDSGGRGEASG